MLESRHRKMPAFSMPLANEIATEHQFKVKTAGNADANNAGVLAELAALIADGKLDVPIAEVYALDDVRKAYRTLEQRHTRGKIVLRP